MVSPLFRTSYRSKISKARLGTITTDHGIIQTPAFVPVATKGTIKSLFPSLLAEIKTQVAFVNTYHLVTHPGADIIEKAGGIHNFSKLNIPLMSDSGGFQVFSLARNKRENQSMKHETWNMKQDAKRGGKFRGGGGVVGKQAMPTDDGEALVEKISEDGVMFRSTIDGTLIEFTPEKSIQYQKQIGADLIMAFDECTYYPATHEYAQKSMERTQRWLERCIKDFRVHSSSFTVHGSQKSVMIPERLTMNQYLYGIIQGGTYEDLRKESAEFVTKQDVDGVAIGGVAVGESKGEMRQQVQWVADYLPENKPVHLLGIGHADDIIDLVKYGVDTFDCVEPTRLARMAGVYDLARVLSLVNPPTGALRQRRTARRRDPSTRDTRAKKLYEIDITKAVYKNNLEKLDEGCNCYVCENFTKAYVRHLFKQRELLGYSLVTYHNLWVMERLMEEIRAKIKNDLL